MGGIFVLMRSSQIRQLALNQLWENISLLKYVYTLVDFRQPCQVDTSISNIFMNFLLEYSPLRNALSVKKPALCIYF